jgi:predicted aldo/keto reductase-like oxidoreductase
MIKHYRREDIILATGVDPRPMDNRTGTFSEKTDIAQYEKDLDMSLHRLDVDYIDILYLPYVAGKHSVTFEPIMNAMEKFKKVGKVRFLGIASHSSVANAVRAAAETGFYDVAMLAYNFRFTNIEEINESIAYAADKGMGIVAMKTITGTSQMMDSGIEIASNPKAALKWVLQNENIHSTVPGVTTFDQLETNISIMEDLTLTPEEKAYIEIAQLNREDGLFCQGCGTCLQQCKEAPDIPTLMRCYMYTYGYRDLAAAVRNIESIKDDPVVCTECSSCVVDCPMGFDIKQKVMDIIRLRDFPTDFFC